jgi:hypothetical protein
MSEHAWVLENIASYHAGGMETMERERLEQHVAACPPCAEALRDAGNVDRTLEALFANVSPDPALEDRLVHSLRAAPLRLRWRPGLPGWIAGSAAAIVLLGALGAGMSSLLANGGLPYPGMASASLAMASNRLHRLGMALEDDSSAPKLDQAIKARGEVATDISLGDVTYQSVVATRRKSEYAGDVHDKETALPPQEEKRGVALNVSGEKLAGGFVLPHTHVDIVSTTPDKNGEADSKTILQNVPVLALDQASVRPGDKQAVLGNTVTVQVTPEQAERLDLAQKKGTISLITRPHDDDQSVIVKSKTASESLQESTGVKSAENPAQKFYTYRNDLPAPVASQSPTYPALIIKAVDPRPVQEELDAVQARRTKAESKSNGGQASKDLDSQERAAEGKPNANQETPPKPGSDQGKAPKAKKPEATVPPPVIPRKIIRSGEIEFEVESFDAAVAAVTTLVGGIRGGFVATVNSEKLANGKVRGAVVVRVPPDNLDALILSLRKELGKAGELRSQRIGSQDITKQYTDLESRLRAARAMEERLLQIIKTGKGEIKDLLQAEKELGVWRTKIEELEGELRYYANQVALSTLTITLYEKEIRSPSAITETERIQMGLEVEDVDKARQQALAAVADAKGRITKSEFKQYEAGQYSALLQFETPPEAAGPLRDRLKQLGTLARLEIDRLQQTEGGKGPPQDAKLKRNDALFVLSLYNLAKVEPRETVNLNLACVDVETVYQSILARVQKTAGRIITSSLNRPSKEQTTGMIKFEVRSPEADAALQNLKEAGEVMRLQFVENPDIQNTTRSKRGFSVSLAALDQVEPREKTDLQIATRDVPAAYRALLEAVARARGRMLNAQLNEQDKQNITAQLDLDIRRTEEAAIEATLSKIGGPYARTVVRAQETENVTDSKVRLKIALINVSRIPPRATYTLGVEVGDVDNTAAALAALVHESQGRTVDSHIAHRSNGSIVAKQVFDVPLAAAQGLLEKFKRTGTVRIEEASRNPQVPETALSAARLDVTLSNETLIVPSDDGLWPQVRRGLSNSLLVIFWSLSWVIFGLMVVLPWALLIYGVYRLVIRLRKRPGSASTAA